MVGREIFAVEKQLLMDIQVLEVMFGLNIPDNQQNIYYELFV
jgi:hypothetical protein